MWTSRLHPHWLTLVTHVRMQATTIITIITTTIASSSPSPLSPSYPHHHHHDYRHHHHHHNITTISSAPSPSSPIYHIITTIFTTITITTSSPLHHHINIITIITTITITTSLTIMISSQGGLDLMKPISWLIILQVLAQSLPGCPSSRWKPNKGAFSSYTSSDQLPVAVHVKVVWGNNLVINQWRSLLDWS